MPGWPSFKKKPYYEELTAFMATTHDMDTGELLDSAVQEKVAAAIADNQTVVDAAAAAVDANPTIADLQTNKQDAVTVQNDGAAVPFSDTINIRGSKKQAVDFSGITHFFVPPTLDIRAYGAVALSSAAWAALDTTTRNTYRAQNTAALQAGCQDSATMVGGTRRVLIPGDASEIYEFDNTVYVNSGVQVTTEHKAGGGQYGAQLHFYGPANAHAFENSSPGRSGFVMQGVRLWDSRGGEAATGTGDGIHFEDTSNGTILEDCYLRGFYRNLYLYNNDMVRVEGGWIGAAYKYGVEMATPLDFNIIRDVAFDIRGGDEYAAQNAIMYVNGGTPSATLEVSNCKAEPNLSTATGLIFRSLAQIHVKGFSFRDFTNGLTDVVRIERDVANGIGEDVTLDHIGIDGGMAANAIRVISDDGENYTLPCHPTQPMNLRHWSAKHRDVNYRLESDGGAWNWTQAASGTAAGTLVPGSGAGTGPSLSATGNDQRGTLTVVSGTSPASSGLIASINYRLAWPRTPQGVMLTPANAAAAALTGSGAVYVGDSTSGDLTRLRWRLRVGSTALAASTTYKWQFEVLP